MYKTIASFPVEDFISIMDKTYPIVPGKRSKLKGRKLYWYNLIMDGRTECVVSKLKITTCSYDMTLSKKPTFHYNFYSECGELFTIDHKIPLSKGGKDNYSNVQPMIADINWEKGNQLIHL